MTIFREKNFGAWSAYKKNAPAIISTTALGISATQLANNKKQTRYEVENNKQQLAAISSLTKELRNTAQSMKDVNTTMKEKGVIVQRQAPAPATTKKRRSLFRW